MSERTPLTDEEGKVREITDDDLKHFRPFEELPEDMQGKLRACAASRRRPPRN